MNTVKGAYQLFRRIGNVEWIRYGFFGVLTSALNIGLFHILSKQLDYRTANLITLIVVKLTAYVCNKLFVFKSHCPDTKTLIKEVLRYVLWRLVTMGMDYFGLILLVDGLHFVKTPAKVLVTGLVIVVNYFTGKLCVFKKHNRTLNQW